MSEFRREDYRQFEVRRPHQPVTPPAAVMMAWQFFATLTLVLGAWYIGWRWLASLNTDALWFALPMALAETLAFIGLVLFIYNLWDIRDPERQPPPTRIGECDPDAPQPDRPVRVDVFITTYNEDEELVRLSILDAKAMIAPEGAVVKVHVCDDGRRPAMAAVAAEEGVGYITRTDNAGYKAGNLRNAMERTDGDFLVICDADTRPFPTLLQHTLGYFRDPKVAFVQTPQWFYDSPPGERLPAKWGRALGAPGRWAARLVEALFGEIRVGEDPFNNDPAIFYDVIMRRRNRKNAAFCCGAASVHRREAVMFVAVKTYADALSQAPGAKRSLLDRLARRTTSDEARALALWQAARQQELTPYKFHVSEDIYTSIVLHQDRERGWKSVMHPGVESRMLSPQDLLTWTIQRFKYAGGSLDILFHDNPLLKRGLSWGQKLMYLSTFWSYLGALWTLVFLAAPIIYLVTAVPPVSAYTIDFFLRIVPFLVALELAMFFGFWGYSGYKSKIYYISSFPIALSALWAVVRGKPIKFHVTPKTRQSGNFVGLVWPQLAIMLLTAAAIVYGALQLHGDTRGYTLEGVLANALWGLNNIAAMALMVRAAFWKPDGIE